VASAVAQLRYAVGTRRAIGHAARRLRRAAARAETPEEALRALRDASEQPIGVAATQVESELTAFLELVSSERPRRLLEIGTGGGGTLYMLAWASAPKARILSLDLVMYPPERRQLYRKLGWAGRRVDAWVADSQREQTRDAVRDWFGGEPVDVLFVDGDHGYDAVRRDFELYGPLVRPGGIVAFHDIVEGPSAVGDVPRFWREIKPSLADPVELVESWQQGGFGIGVGRRRPTAG
jgi:predicted O-methyltransferase YrrM